MFYVQDCVKINSLGAPSTSTQQQWWSWQAWRSQCRQPPTSVSWQDWRRRRGGWLASSDLPSSGSGLAVPSSVPFSQCYSSKIKIHFLCGRGIINYSKKSLSWERNEYYYVHLCRFVMVSNARHNPDHEKMKMFNLGYLVGLSGILLVWNINFIVFLFKPHRLSLGVSKCLGLHKEADTSLPMRIATVGFVLLAVFSVFIYIRTQQYLKNIRPFLERFHNIWKFLLHSVWGLVRCVQSYSFWSKTPNPYLWGHGGWHVSRSHISHTLPLFLHYNKFHFIIFHDLSLFTSR